jgi:hypothetical protein
MFTAPAAQTGSAVSAIAGCTSGLAIAGLELGKSIGKQNEHWFDSVLACFSIGLAFMMFKRFQVRLVLNFFCTKTKARQSTTNFSQRFRQRASLCLLGLFPSYLPPCLWFLRGLRSAHYLAPHLEAFMV